MKRFKKILLGGLLVLIVLIAVVAVYVYRQLTKDTIKLGNTSSEIAFLSDREGNWDIVLLSPDGTLTNLTQDSKGHEYFLNFTFDGEGANFYTSDSGGITPGYAKADGSDFQALSWERAFLTAFTEGRLDNDPTWGPGGEQMVWSKLLGLNIDLYMANADGSDEHSLADKGPSDSAPAWSPDGKKLAFTADKSGGQNIYLMDLESGEITQLTDGYWDFQPAWSKDGERLLFVRDIEDSLLDGNLTLYIMNPDGSDLRPFEDSDTFEGDLTYSPASGEVAYMTHEDGQWHIFVMNADGSDKRQVTSGDSNNLFPSWRPVPAE